MDHPAGWVAIPLSARSIPAYTEVTRDYLLNPKTGELVVKWVAAERRFPKGIITDLSKILKRVTAREKPAVYYFLESDFLPEGTRPGIAGGTPLGKRAITLDAGKLKGVHELKEGDHVDLLASVAVDMPGAGHSNSGRMGTNVVASPDALLLPKRGFVRPLVEDGVVVTPVKIRNVADHGFFAHPGRDHPHHAGAGDRARRGARRSAAAGRGHGFEVRDHLRGAFGPPGVRSVVASAAHRLVGLRRV